MAASRSLWSARYTASGIVWVTPGMLPAKVMVAPNSPSARAQLIAAPAKSDGAASGASTRRKVYPGPALSVAAGAVLCWARALGEFGATITFAGNFPGTTQTMPLAVYLALQRDPEAAIVLSLVLLVVSLATLLLLRDRWLGRMTAPVA